MGDIDPRGEEFAMFIPRFGRFSNVVARGHHLRLPLRSQNRESCAPWSEKYSTINQKNVEDGTISVIVTKFVIGEEGRHHPLQQDSRPLPKTHPDTTSI